MPHVELDYLHGVAGPGILSQPYKRFQRLQGGAKHLSWLRRNIPELVSIRGRCIALYGGVTASNMAPYRDMLVRAGFPCVCGLSLSFLVASSSRANSTALDNQPAKARQVLGK